VPGPSVVVRVLGDLKGLGDSFQGASKQAQTAGSKVHSAFSSVLATLNKTGVLGPFGEVLAGLDEGLGRLADHGKTVGQVMLGVGAAMVGVGGTLTVLGSKEKAASQQLKAAIEATGRSYDQYEKKISAAVKAQERYGHSTADTEGALQRLTQATHDPQQALDMLGLASDLAAAKHEDLGAAADQLGKVYNGNTKLLKQFGIQIDTATGKTKDGRTATQALADVLRGQAAAASDTFTGKLKALTTTIEDQVSAFGQRYGPAITAAGAGITALGGVVEIASSAQEIWTTVTAAFTAVEYASLAPILLIIAAVAALGVGIYLLVRNWSTVWSAIKTAVEAVWNWIKTNWPLLAAILLGPFAVAAFEVAKHWRAILDGAKTVVRDVGQAFTGVGKTIANAFGDAWRGLEAGAKDAVKAVVRAFSGLGSEVSGSLSGLWGNLAKGASSAVSSVAGVAGNLGSGIGDAFGDAFSGLGSSAQGAARAISSIWGDVETQARNAAHFISSVFSGVWGGLEAGARAVGSVFTSAFSGLEHIVNAIAGVLDVGQMWSGATQGLQAAYKTIVALWDAVIGYVRGVPARLAAALGDLWGVVVRGLQGVYGALGGLWGAIIGFVAGVPGRIRGALGDPWHWLVQGLAGAYGAIVGLVNRIVGYVGGLPGRIGAIGGHVWNGFRGMYNHIASAWNGLHFTLPHIDVGPIHFGGQTFGVPRIPLLAQGGLITKSGLVFAHAGEAITPAPGRTGPAFTVENVNLNDGLDVETFFRKAAWVVATEAV
jgi:phage-related protein